MRGRRYGDSGPELIVLHGGPGAPGFVAPVARGLADGFRVLEPWQRASSDRPLTVARHVADLLELIDSLDDTPRPALVGASWGAMLALAFAAEHPDRAGPLVLIGCGTFDLAARARMDEVLDERIDAALRRRLEALAEECPDPDERLKAMGELLLPVFAHDPLTRDLEIETCDARGHEETWGDMLRLQAEGVYPAAFRAIRSPVLMLHGAEDPHPGRMVRDGLLPVLPRLEYREWEGCGHYPWIERGVRDEFFERLRGWLAKETR